MRIGAFRGRSLTLCQDLSPVAHCSKNGQNAAPPRMHGQRQRERDEHAERIVCPRKFHSQAGIMRSEPSRMPMYQSGWDADEIGQGVYGP